MSEPSRVHLPGPVYRVEIDFRAPLNYVFRWLTDYRTDDAKREGERYERRVLERSRSRVVFEDLESDADGWAWARVWVTLRPPNAYHAERRGNRREWSVDYRLSSRGPAITHLSFRGRRRGLVPEKRLSRAQRERVLDGMWQHFRRALEADYRKAHRGPARRPK